MFPIVLKLLAIYVRSVMKSMQNNNKNNIVDNDKEDNNIDANDSDEKNDIYLTSTADRHNFP